MSESATLLMAAIFYDPVIRAPALPSVLVFNTMASTDGKAEARIKKSHNHVKLASTLLSVNGYVVSPLVSLTLPKPTSIDRK